MPIELPTIAYSEQRMQEPRIPNVNLRGFYQPLPNVCVRYAKSLHSIVADACKSLKLIRTPTCLWKLWHAAMLCEIPPQQFALQHRVPQP